MAVIIIAIPGLILEVSIGQAYRGGSVIAYNGMNKRLKGTGLSLLFIGFMVLTYFNVIVTWIMVFFRHSFSNPLPWSDRDPEEFFMQDVLRVVPPVEGSPYATYPSIAMIGELAGWCAFVWFLVWIWYETICILNLMHTLIVNLASVYSKELDGPGVSSTSQWACQL